MKRFVLVLFLVIVTGAFSQEIQYQLIIEKPHRHYFTVRITYQSEGKDQVDFVMPAWSPGFYGIKNLAKNVVRVQAESEAGKALPFRKIDKQTWRVKTSGVRQVSLSYQVYAYSPGNPYNAHLEPDFAYYNGANLFMYVDGEKQRPVRIRFQYPEGWDFYTSLPLKYSEREYGARDYDEFIDSPSFFGKLAAFSFRVRGVPHHFVLNGGYPYNRKQIESDLSKMVNWFAAMFGELPYREYTFFLRVDKPGRGGLEHANSNVSCAIPEALSGDLTDSRYFGNLLMLETHEFFHAYNVKRIRPTGLIPFDYTKEVYIELLWVSEGFTSYYTHRPLAKVGIVAPQEVYKRWARYYNSLFNNSALSLKSVAQYSFDSWISDSDIPDYTFRVFYAKGAMIALLLDIDMRLTSNHQKSMDGFFRYLYWNVYKKGETFDLPRFLQLLNDYSGNDYTEFFWRYVTGVEPLPLQEYLNRVGLELRPEKELPFLGLKFDSEALHPFTVYYVYPDTPADRLEIARGDRLVGVNGKVVSEENWEELLKALPIGQPVQLSWVHKGELRSGSALLTHTRPSAFTVTEKKTLSERERDFLHKWLYPDK